MLLKPINTVIAYAYALLEYIYKILVYKHNNKYYNILAGPSKVACNILTKYCHFIVIMEFLMAIVVFNNRLFCSNKYIYKCCVFFVCISFLIILYIVSLFQSSKLIIANKSRSWFLVCFVFFFFFYSYSHFHYI